MENINELYVTIAKLKPSTVKGAYVRSVYVSSTMSPGIEIEPKSLEN